MLLVRLVRWILNAFRHPDCKGQPMTKSEAEALVREMAVKHPEAASLNVDASVVDVCKALGLDASFPARLRYAAELGLEGNYTGTSEHNRWLRDELLVKVAENDVESLRD